MTPASAAAIGRTLSRLGRVSHVAAEETTSASRDAVFRAISEAGEPIPIDGICAKTALHANTVRPHLDVLLATGRITREQGRSVGRGRPRWLYRPVETDAMRQRTKLADALVQALQGADSAELARAAAGRWAEQLDPDHRPGPAQTADDAVLAAADSLTRLGFETTVTPLGDRIDLRSCPYADLVADRPVICDIHAALVLQLLEASGQPVELERFDVFPRPGVCTAHLRRGDQRPVRTITMRSPE